MISFSYIYRDADNYKNYGEVIFTNTTGLTPEQITEQLTPYLEDGEYFKANLVNIPEVFLYGAGGYRFDPDSDHEYHEFAGVEVTDQEPTDEQGRDITHLLQAFHDAHNPVPA